MSTTTPTKKASAYIITVAIAVPLRRVFDYLPPKGLDTEQGYWRPGMRVQVPFGNQKSTIGVVVNTRLLDDSINQSRLKPIQQALEKGLSPEIFKLSQWCASYYHFSLGEVCHLALPALLRKTGELPVYIPPQVWQLTPEGQALDEDSFGRAAKQKQLWQMASQGRVSPAELKAAGITRSVANTMVEKRWLALVEDKNDDQPGSSLRKLERETSLALNNEQEKALASIKHEQFGAYLLDGVTGSGKTEIYLQAIAKVVAKGQQALVLIPEIGLTPQTLSRFEKRFTVPVISLHSGMTDKQRYEGWLQAKEGRAAIVLGTRSAIFTALPKLGLIIVDEEHDLSYKQQEGVRYSARDVAVVRAHQQNIPIILGSATPSLESLQNARSGRFQHLCLTRRATDVVMPEIRCIPQPETDLASEIQQAIAETLEQGQQVLVFINRRGYAPTLFCRQCHWIQPCHQCDSRMTVHHYHSARPYLHCHHCDARAPLPTQCPQCHSTQIEPLGEGTQRSEGVLQQQFSHYPVIRIDRDSVSRKGVMEEKLSQINRAEPCILVGTQMLAKGHHFSQVSLVVVLGLDNGFFSSDFRGAERMAQLLTQVSGRSGREVPGKVLLQTQFAEHPHLQLLIQRGYSALANQLLGEREIARMPPFCHLALLRCHAHQAGIAIEFLQKARRQAEQLMRGDTLYNKEVNLLGPLPSGMEKRNNRYYYQLQITSMNRQALHGLLKQLCEKLEAMKSPTGLHWLIDVDAQEV